MALSPPCSNEELLARTHLREVGCRVYEWCGHESEEQRAMEAGPVHIFGGVLISQAAAAAMHAMRSVEKEEEKEEELQSPNRQGQRRVRLNSLHGSFCRRGDGRKSVLYTVEGLQEGGSFTRVSVHARQGGILLFTAIVSLSILSTTPSKTGKKQYDNAAFQRVAALPRDVVPPEAAHSFVDSVRALPLPWASRAARIGEESVKSRNGFARINVLTADKEPMLEWSVRTRNTLNDAIKTRRRSGIESGLSELDIDDRSTQRVWMKFDGGAAGEDRAAHVCLLLHLSDMLFIDTAIHRYGLALGNSIVRPLSLDHAIHMHDDDEKTDEESWRVDEYLLFEISVVTIRNGRALCQSKIYSRRGGHIATAVQEGLLKLDDRAKPRL